MKKKLIIILLFTVITAAIAFFSYYIYENVLKTARLQEAFLPQDINVDDIESDLEFAETLPEYLLVFTGLIDGDWEITFYDIVDIYGETDKVETFNATGIRTDDELVEAEFTGIKLKYIIDNLNVNSDAKNVIIFATDMFAANFTIEEFLNGEVYIVWKKSGQYLNPTADGILKIVQDGSPTYKWVKNPVVFDFVSDFDDMVPLADRLEEDAMDFISEQRFYTLSLGFIPDIDIGEWKLDIGGLIKNPTSLSYDDILKMPQISVFATLETISNPPGGKLKGNATWTGVPFDYILELADLDENVLEVIFYSEDGYSTSLTIDEVSKEGVMLSYRMNGKPLIAEHGFPVRMVVPGKYGMKWPKWINKIEFVDYDYKGYWEQRGWSDYAGRDRPDQRYE